jgi:DNA/RNA endonuclease G (NUC1)
MKINYSVIVGSVIILFPALTFSQITDTITIHHKYYSTTFSKSKCFPIVVKYWITKKMLDCEHRIKRSKRFTPVSLLPEFTNLDKDYKKSGYDRGHLMDAYDCGCDSTAMAESFYYSNIALQLPALNRGNWKKLEGYTRKLVKEYDSILVWCGSVSFSDRYVKRNSIVKAYSFRNSKDLEEGLHFYEVSIDSIQNMTGFRFIKVEIRTTK